ncbi:hypothetical protein CHS0354_019522 [Potamilus streckersoni]|uniref:Novel STAND NTPase 3 domain-containing protein n=1 Tax=Potamilus streckersoni TaxID=2493646 RepID=A0AAE0VVM3_9BIVA|nr:hypothetical protein CHS0354_019522 [Potamilus streckersoni]
MYMKISNFAWLYSYVRQLYLQHRKKDIHIDISRDITLTSYFKEYCCDISQTLLEQHRFHAEKNFIETQGYRDANKKLRQHRKLIITGKSGQGKTYLACHLLNKIMADNSDIRPLIVSTAEQWKTLVDSSTTLGVIVDDMCGRFCVNEELKKWREESTYMPGLIENGKHVVIFTMKSHLQEKILEAIEPISSSEEITLELDTISLTLAEKKEFAIRYLNKFNLNEAEVSHLCEKINEAHVGFPQMCRTAEMITEKSKLINLFSEPRELMLKQMKHFQRYDIMAYSCLIYVMLSEGKLNLQLVRDLADSSKQRGENKVISVFKLCGIPCLSPSEVLNTLPSLENKYISFNQTEESYFFIHDSIAEAVFISYAKMYLQETLLYCPLELICKHCIIQDESEALEKTENILISHPSCQAILINRFITALKGGNPKDFTIISETNIWSSKDFRNAFIAECKEVHYLADTDDNSLLVHAVNANNRDLVEELLHELDNISEDKMESVSPFLTKSAKSSCAHKDTNLLEKICAKGHVDANDILPNIIEQGSVDAIEFLLQSGADVNYRSENGENLLHIASLHGRLDIVKLLHSRNPNIVKEFDHDNRSVIHSAASGGSVDIVIFLLQLDLNLLHTDSTGWNLLHYACWHAKKEVVEYLLDKYPFLFCSRTDEGMSVLLCSAFGGNIYIFKNMHEVHESLLQQVNTEISVANAINSINSMMLTTAQETLLHMSCLGGSLEMSKYLAETYPKMLHEKDNGKRTPAHYAAAGGNVAIVSYLIDLGTDPWCRTSEEETLLHEACNHGKLEMTIYLVETYPTMLHDVDNDKRKPAHHAAAGGNVAVLSYLIDRGTDPWCRTSEEETLLHIACIHGKLEMTKYLVETYPTMLHEVDNSKRKPAHHAAVGGNVAVLGYLIYRGTDPWCRTSDEETLLHIACIHGKLEITKYLAETYPKMLHEVDNGKRTPAHHAAVGTNVVALAYLIDRGTDPRCRTSEDETLLHIACINGKLEITKYLVETYPKMLHEVDKGKNTPAHHAAAGGNLAVLSYLIDRGTDPRCRTSDGKTLLHIGCIHGKLEMTKYLVETYPKMLHEVDKCRTTPAHHAAAGGNVAVLSYLIDRGTDPWCRTSEKETLLHRACIHGKLEMTIYLVETYPKMLHEVDNGKRTPAHHAAAGGNVAVLSYLIDRGTDPWCRTYEEETLLHRACIHGKLEMTKYLVETYPKMLLEVDNGKSTPAHHAASGGNVAVLSYIIDRGTDPWCKSSEEETLLHRACIHSNIEMTKYLVETYPKILHVVDNCTKTPAHHVAAGGNVAVLRYIIDRGTDPWCRTSDEETLLHIACIHGKLEMTKYLVETYPKMMHEVDNGKRTPAHHAASGGYVAVLSYLIDRGTDPWCRTSVGETLLHRACLQSKIEMTKYLLKSYPNMQHVVDNVKKTPAYYAAASGNVAVLAYLIDRGTDPWCRTSEEETLLHIACIFGKLEMTKYLVKTYPKMLHQVDNSKRTPAHHATAGGNVAVLSYLIDRGTDLWCRTSDEETLLHRACICGKLDVTKYLVDTYPKMLPFVDNDKRTPAHHAAAGGNIAVLSYLIDRGIDPRCRTSSKETLLHRACIYGKLEMTKYLVETYPIMLHEVDNGNRTPAYHAAAGGNVAVLSYLIDRGSDPWCRSSEEETLLHIACIPGKLEMTKYLVETYPKMLHEVDNCKRTPAHQAAAGGNVSVLCYLLDRGTDPWCRTSAEETLLHRACIYGKLEMTKYLVQTYPKMLHEVDNGKKTPAHYAAAGGNVAVLCYLIESGTDPWCRSTAEETLLHRACIHRKIEMTKYLVDTYPKMLHEVDNGKSTPAHHAAAGGNVVIVSHLIERGTDPWCRNSEEETLLHEACNHGKLEMTKYLVETYPKMLHEVDTNKKTPAHHAAAGGNVPALCYLIDRGIDPRCRTSQEETLLHRACFYGKLEMTKYLVETYPKMLHEVDTNNKTPAHHAAAGGNVHVLCYLIDGGIDPLCRTSQEETLLHRACIYGKLKMTKYLVETYPIMLHEVDNGKRTPAHHATAGGNLAVLAYLIDRGTDPWCRTSDERTLLHIACIHGKLEMTKYLVETYPKMLHEVDNGKRTPAHHAASGGNVAVLRYLIDRGTDPWCRTSDEKTLLHIACIHGKLEMTKYLVETYPIMLHEVDNGKRTPAHHAAAGGNVAVLSYLIDRGTDPWCRTSEGETLLHRACIYDKLEMTKYLVETYPKMLHEVDNYKKTPALYAEKSNNVSVLCYLRDAVHDNLSNASFE